MRWYDPYIGRFLTRDPIGIWGDPMNLGNGTAYVGNNPWSYVDPYGLETWCRSILDWGQQRAQVATDFYQRQGARLAQSNNGAVSGLGTAVDAAGTTASELFDGSIGFLDLGTHTGARAGVGGSWEDWALDLSHDAGLAGEGILFLMGPISGSGRNAASAVDEAGEFLEAVGDGAKRVDGVFKEVAPAKRASDTTVIGRYPDYALTADTYGFRRFEIPPDTWAKMSEAEQWAANQKYLDRAIEKGDQILLSTPANEADVGTFFRRELDYLEGKGYCMSEDGMTLVPGGN